MLKSSYASRSIGGFDDAARAAVEGAVWAGRAGRVPAGVDWSPTGDDFEIVPVTAPLERLPTTGIIYLGSPYSKQADLDEAADIAEQAAACIMRRGHTVYAPIAHGHTIARHGLPSDWSFWKRQCEPFIDAASALVVLKLDGWRDSVGLTYEIARFHEAGKPIVYVTMEDLANG